MIHEKLALIETKQKNKNKINNFFSQVEEIIKDANSTLSEESQQKVIAKSNIKYLEDNVKEYFSKYARLKEATKTIESFDYSKKETVEIYEEKSKLEKLITGYDFLEKKFSDNIITLSGEGDTGMVTKRILERIKDK